MNRRHALKGLGTFIALPMLDCMTPLMAAEPVMPKRSAVHLFAQRSEHARLSDH
jgi:hypothetical protein